ncbi:MAG TPA: EexN family lipoprotein [Caulobacteraceae bacterium]
MRILPVAVVLALGGALVACTPPTPAHDKAYYLAHADERTKTIAGCRNDPDTSEKTPNCVNAAVAAGQVESDRFWAVKKPKSRVTNPNSL